ncbi:MAG: CBS domain-containing protein [Cyanobacteria bacterium P01_F01_bin.53]
MDLVLCHTTADFDTLGAAVGAACLRPGSRIVLTGGAHPTVQNFLALWRDEYPLIDRRAVDFETVRSLTLVDASGRDRFSPVSDWLQQAEKNGLPIYIYDHHIVDEDAAEKTLPAADFPMAESRIESVGAATTLLVECLQQHALIPTPFEATVMALGIHSDTGSLTFEQSTDRDAFALAWLMSQGANQQVIAENKEPGLSPQLQDLLGIALETIEVSRVRGHQLGWVQLETPVFVPGLSGLTERLMTLLGLDTLLLCSVYRSERAVMIGRSCTNPLLPHASVNLRPIFEALGGGGHAQAASAVLQKESVGSFQQVFSKTLEEVRSQIPHQNTARFLMSSPVRTILPTTTVDEAHRTLLRYGHVGVCVVNPEGRLVGMICRRDIDIALRHGLGHSPVTGCMSVDIKSIEPDTPVTEIQSLMTTYDIGRLPVLNGGSLIGIVTRTDLLRQLHQLQQSLPQPSAPNNLLLQGQSPEAANLFASGLPNATTLYQQLESRISAILPALMLIAEAADQRGWALYVVGGAVRDLLLGMAGETYPLTDIDLVVDGAGEGAGVALAEALQVSYPQVTVQVHGQFQTASLVWHAAVENVADPDDALGSNTWHGDVPLLIDIATARTEFYPYPAANPEVEASTIRQDLYRRDFTINAMALRLNGPTPGQLLDFFGGWADLQHRYVRVLHANSFIEDPTRIFRAVKFATRLGFSIDAQSDRFIRHAISSGVYERMHASVDKTPALQSRLKAELQYILSAEHWAAALETLDDLEAWRCVHASLSMTSELWCQLRRMERWLNKFDVAEPRWLMLLELILAQLEPRLRGPVASNLDLSAQSVGRLTNLHQQESDLFQSLPRATKPSQIYDVLHGHSLSELLLICARHPYTLARQIWQYIVRLSRMPPLINGGTLKRLGYKPGPQFRNILTAVHYATLDGELTTVQAAETYVLANYPV